LEKLVQLSLNKGSCDPSCRNTISFWYKTQTIQQLMYSARLQTV